MVEVGCSAHDARACGDRDIFFAAVRMSPVPMCLSDPNRPDNPLVFVNRAFEDLTGYPREEVLGRNCRFLQGPQTDRDVVAEVRRSIAAKVDVSVEFYNYRKDGSGFWNALYLSPVLSDMGDLLYFFASQLDVTKRREAEVMLQRARQVPSFADRRFPSLTAVVSGQMAGGVQGSTARGQDRPTGWKPTVVTSSSGSARAGFASVPSRGGGAALVLQPVRVDTRSEDEEGYLVFGDERLVAVLVRLSGQHGALAGCWHLEQGFGLLSGPDHPCFTSLDAARSWMGQRLGRTGTDNE